MAACGLLAGCPGGRARFVPRRPPPADGAAATAWARATLPGRRTAIRFHWKYQDVDKRWGGGGRARIAPPDSLRFDYVGPLGLGAGAAVVVGDSAIWAHPERNFRSLVPAGRMLWAGLGIVRPPPADAGVFGVQAPPVAVWRFVEAADTFDYRVTDHAAGDRLLEAEWRREGKVVARSRTQFDSHAMPASARIDFPEVPARFELSGIDARAGPIGRAHVWTP